MEIPFCRWVTRDTALILIINSLVTEAIILITDSNGPVIEPLALVASMAEQSHTKHLEIFY